LRILDLLTHGEKSASELSSTLQLPAEELSEHLTILLQAKIIVERAEGDEPVYLLHPAVHKKGAMAERFEFGPVAVTFRRL
jgi:DNA-binding transcriptional ArsR family regulator